MESRRPAQAIGDWSRTSLRLVRVWFERARALHIFAILEIVTVVAVAILIARFFYEYGGQLLGTDTLGYVNVGFRRAMGHHMLNRYVHIYGLRILTSLALSPLDGLRYFSSIAAGLTVLLGYYSARSMSKQPQIVRGVIAVTLLLGLPVIVDRLLAPNADTSAMVAVLLLTAIYVRSAKGDHNNPWVIRLLGLVIFLAFRTKETTLVWSVTLIGLGIADGSRLDSKKLLKNLLILLQGLFAGLITMAIANWIFVGEPLFGLRPSDLSGYGAIWEEVANPRSDPFDVFAKIILPHGSLAFILFMVAGLWGRSNTSRSFQLLWLVPLALLILLAVTMNRITAGITPRHYLPGFALLAVLGSQVAGSRLPPRANQRTAIWLFLGTLGLIGTVVVIGLSLRSTLPFPRYFEAILAPIAFAVAFGLIVMFSKRRRMVELPVLLCLLIVTIYPIRFKFPKIAMENPILLPNARFDAVLAFEDQFVELESATTFVSGSMLPHLQIHLDRNKLRALFNVALDARTERDNFEIGGMDAELIKDLELGKFSHVLISSDDWEWMRTAPQDRPEWRDQYSSIVEPSGRFVLLVKEAANP